MKAPAAPRTEAKAGGFPHLTYVDKDRTVADMNTEIAAVQERLDAAEGELDTFEAEIERLRALLTEAIVGLDPDVEGFEELAAKIEAALGGRP